MPNSSGQMQSGLPDPLGVLTPPSTKERILREAIKLFSERGYDAVSVRDIAQAVGIKDSSLYNHYPSKEAILTTVFALFENAVAKTILPLEALPGILAEVTPKEFLAKGLELVQAQMGTEPMEQIWRVVYLEQYRNKEARQLLWEKVIMRTMAFLEEAFRQMAARGRIKNIDPSLLASEYQYPIYLMMTAYVIAKLDGRDTDFVMRKMREHVEFFWEVIRVDREGEIHEVKAL